MADDSQRTWDEIIHAGLGVPPEWRLTRASSTLSLQLKFLEREQERLKRCYRMAVNQLKHLPSQGFAHVGRRAS